MERDGRECVEADVRERVREELVFGFTGSDGPSSSDGPEGLNGGAMSLRAGTLD